MSTSMSTSNDEYGPGTSFMHGLNFMCNEAVDWS